MHRRPERAAHHRDGDPPPHAPERRRVERRRDSRSRERQDLSRDDEAGRGRQEADRAGVHRDADVRPLADVGASRRVRLWRFALASAPYGSFNGLVAVGLPYILRQRGIPVERIAIVEALVQAPSIWFFLWGPVVDLALRRMTWIVVLSVSSAFCAAAALGDSTATVRSLTTLLVLASIFSQPVSSALGGLVASVVPNEHRGRTAGWSQAGIFIGGVVTGASTVWLSGHASGRM